MVDSAEVILIYSENIEGQIPSAVTNTNGNVSNTTLNERDVWTGKGMVVKQLQNGNQRLIMDSKSSQTFRWEKAPATAFGKAFVKAFVAANVPLKENK